MSKYPNEYFKTIILNDGILHVIVNRPNQLNAFHKPAYLEYGRIFKIAASDPEVRSIVVSGEGRAFSSGLDVIGMADEFGVGDDNSDQSRNAIRLGGMIREFQESIAQPYYVNKPVIGVAHGPCIGLAIDILTAVDIRYASRDANFSVREINLGMAADIGTLQRLPRIVGNLGWVKDVCFTGRDFSSEEAMREGFIQKLYESKEEALTGALNLARELATKSPVALFGTKKSINYALDHTHVESLNQIAEFNSYGLGADFTEGCMAMLESIQSKTKILPSFSRL